MTSVPSSVVLDPDVRQLIQSKARRLFRSHRPRAMDLQDVEQLLVTELLSRLQKHIPRLGQEEQWIKMLLWQIGASYHRDTSAIKRRDRTTVSAQSLIANSQIKPSPLESSFSQVDARKHRRVEYRPQTELSNQSMDIDELLKSVPPEVREIAQRLKYQNPSEVARELGIGRWRVYEAIQLLRTLLASLRENS